MKAQDLKKSILQYAMQGKLVTQDPTDEPASELLRRIRAEKEKLIKEGKIKKEKPLPPITKDEIPYELPQGWQWVRVNDLGTYKKGPFGSALTKKIFVPKSDDTIKVYEQKNAIQKNAFLGDYYISKEYYEKSMKSFTVLPGDVIVSCAGTIGETYILPSKIETGIINQALMRMRITKEIDIKFFLTYFEIILKQTSIEKSKGSAIKNIPPFEIFKSMLVPLPPLAEQKRIIEKLEEILPLVEEYGKNEEILSEMNQKLPKQIRQSILQYAVQGKLVEQNPQDEPASELLKQIKAEKERLIKDGKIKKEKPLPPITKDEIPYEIPQSWEWVRLGDILTKLTDGAHRTPHYQNSGVPFLSVKDISSGYIDFSNTKFISKPKHEELFKRCNPQKGDILLTKVGTTGIPAIVETDQVFSLFVSVALLKFNNKFIDIKYLYNLILSPLVQAQAKENTKGIGNKNWVIDKIAQTLIPLPPLAEQKRIVAKVEELLNLVNKLENK